MIFFNNTIPLISSRHTQTTSKPFIVGINKQLLSIIICFISFVSFAQLQPKIPHETINNLEVKYHSTANATPSSTISVAPNCTLTLKNSQNVKSVKLQVISKLNQSILYTVSYPINASPVTTNNNLVFSNNTTHIYLSTPNTYPLGTIKLRVFTTDLQDKESKPFETN